MKNLEKTHHASTRILSTVIAALILAATANRIIAAPTAEMTVSFLDEDSDGWDDRWAAKYPEIDRSAPFLDPDGDGIPNFFEMATNQNPFVAPPARAPKAKSFAEMELRRQKLEVEQARMRAALAPYVNRGLRDRDDKPITRVGRTVVIRKRLAELSAKLRIKAAGRENRIKAFLCGPGKNLPERLHGSLDDVEDGVPRFVSGLSYRQARQLEIRRLWPGWINGPSLTGMGTAVAMWDLGGVDIAHEQFANGTSTVVAPDIAPITGRVVNINGNGSNEHATAVATVIVGAGDPSDLLPGLIGNSPTTARAHARGMAYEGGIRAYSSEGDTIEMAEMADMTLAGTLDIVFSNHAYGTSCGWELPYLAPPGTMWTWWGDPSIGESSFGAGDGKEDFKFGFYSNDARDIDAVVYAAEVLLPIWAAGNSGENISAIEAPENQTSRPPLPIYPHVVALTGEIYDTDPGTSHPFPPLRFPNDIPHGIIPEACAKNVLSVTTRRFEGSEGPTDDLRMKPEIAASASSGAFIGSSCALGGGFGNGYRYYRGTSFSAAGVTGGLALLQQRRRELMGESHHLLASTWKAIILSATSANRSGSDSYTMSSPTGYFGFSIAHRVIERAAQITEFGAHAVIKEVILENGGSIEFKCRRDEDFPHFQGNSAVTVCWTDPEGTPPPRSLNPDDPMLVNDIDVRVFSESGTEIFPYYVTNASGSTARGDNDRDNVEHVVFSGPNDEEFTVRIDHKGNLFAQQPQPVSIVLGSAISIAPVFKILDFSQTAADTYNLTWASTVGGVYQIEASSDLTTWTAFPGEVMATNEITSYPLDTSTAGSSQFFRVRQTY